MVHTHTSLGCYHGSYAYFKVVALGCYHGSYAYFKVGAIQIDWQQADLDGIIDRPFSVVLNFARTQRQVLLSSLY